MYINNRQKFEDNQKEVNDNINNENNNVKLKLFSKKKLIKPSQNLAFLPKLIHPENKNDILKNEKIKNSLLVRSSSEVMTNKYNINSKEKEKEDYKEELLILNNLWEELGVTKNYQEQFNHLLINENLRKTMIYQEKESLQKFRNSLMKLRKEIICRENNIESLIKIIRILETENMKDNLLKEVISIIKSLRLNAVNIVFYMIKIRELAFYYYFQGKWDLTKIKIDYLYNNSYLLKMKDDLNFIVNSILKNYIEMNNFPIDAFLTNCSQRNNNKINQDKIIIPITDELSKLIEQCKFIIIQDKILDNIYNNNFYTQYNNRENSGNIRIRKFSAQNREKPKGIFNYINNKDLNNNLNKCSQNIPNLTKSINLLKNDNYSDYNNLFINNKITNLNSNYKETRKIFETRKKLRSPNKNKYKNNYMQNYDSPKRIIVEHDIINSLNSKNKNDNINPNNINRNELYYKSDNAENKENKVNKINNENINNNFENEKINNILKENEKLKKDNEEIKKELLNSKEKMEQNDKLRKNLENKIQTQKEEMKKLSNSVDEIKQQLILEKKELEQKLNEEKEKNKEVERKNKEMEEKIKKQIMINKEIEIQIIKKNEIIKNNNEIIERKQSESIKEDDYINKNEDNKSINENIILNDEIKENFDERINDNNNIYVITNSEKEDSKKNIDNNDDFKNIIKKNNNEKEVKNNINEKNSEYNNIDNKINDENDIKMNKSLQNMNENDNMDEQSKEETNKISEKEIIMDEINIKEKENIINNKYKVENYKGNIISFINELKLAIPFEKIDDDIKIIFDLENKIYNEDSYLIGQYPQIIVCKSYEKESQINGFCSFYYQNITSNENILRINFMCAIEDNNNKDNKNDLFEQFYIMINYIKNNNEYDELYITLNYKKIILDKQKVQFNINEKILNFFKEMEFSWVYVENLKDKTREQQLCYKNKNVNNKFNYEKGFLNSETISILSFIQKDYNSQYKYNYNSKYINNLPIYAILTGQKELLLVDFKENKYRFDSSKLNSKENQIITFFFPENKELEELKEKLNNGKDEKDNVFNIIEESLFFDYYNKDKDKNKDKDNQLFYSFGLFKMNINIFFKNILTIKINNYYYNRISNNEIEIIEDKENECILYLLPCLNKIYDILIMEINDKIKNSFIDNKFNLNELFIKYFNKIKENKNIIEKKIIKNIYIPLFNLETHLQTEKVSKEINNICIKKNIEDEKQNIPMKIGTVDEFLKINCNKKILFENQINYEINDNNKDIIIENDFIICVLNNYIDIKFPLYQLIYVEKEYWIKVETE